MIYLLMIDSGEDRRKFVILYETYRHFMMKIALDILKDAYLAEDCREYGQSGGNRIAEHETVSGGYGKTRGGGHIPEEKETV